MPGESPLEPAAPGSWGYRPALDGLRAVAIALVIGFHAGLGHLATGFIGVDAFFVLSGFLMANVLAGEFAATGTVRLRRFYARRVRRLLPAAVATVVVVCAISVVVETPLRRATFGPDARAALLYFANWHFRGNATDYFAETLESSPFLHFWSLAIEEQFYVAFPVVVLAALVLGRRVGARWTRWQRWPLRVVLGAGAAASLAYQLVLAGDDPIGAYYGTFARLYQLLAGAWAATMLAGSPRVAAIAARRPRLPAAVAAGGLAGLVVTGTDALSMSASSRGVVATACALAVVAGVELGQQAGVARVLASDPLVYLGRISYGIYLWHWPLIVLSRPLLDLTAMQTAALSAIGGAALAALSFQMLELPIRESRPLGRRPVPVVASGLCVSIVCATVVVPQILDTDRRPLYALRADPMSLVDDPEVRRLLAGAPPQLERLDPAEYHFDRADCTAKNPEGCIVRDGGEGALHLHLVGDSNAAVLVGMLATLAEEHDFTFSSTTWPGCPWQLGVVWESDVQPALDACIWRRDRWYDSIIPALGPDVIIATNIPRDPGSSTARVWADLDGRPREGIADVTDESLNRLITGNRRIVLLEPLPYPLFDPNGCLSSALTIGECAYRPPDGPFDTERVYREQDDEHEKVYSVDYDRAACPHLPICIPVIEGKKVFDDSRHLDSGWLNAQRDEIWEAIESSGAIAAVRDRV